MWYQKSLSRQLILACVLCVALLFSLYGFWQIQQVKSDTQEQVKQDIGSLVSLSATQIRGFFEAKGQIIHSVFANPQVLDWFERYDDRGGAINQDQDYRAVWQYFKFFSDKDTSIKSVFFGSANTFEYFDLNGRYDGDPNYYTNKRPWWAEAQGKGRLYVSDPAVDANDGSISATVKTPVTRDGRFLGIGGMDILITTIGEQLLGKIKYQGVGNAFLVTDKGVLVYFPGFGKDFPPGSDMADVDSKFADTSGFSALKAMTFSKDSGNATVTWQGEQFQVLFEPVHSEYPYMDWKLGFMVPESVIEEPVIDAMLSTLTYLMLMLVIIAAGVAVIIKPILRPLNVMLHAMADISRGEGDLTKRLDIERADEVGQLAKEFNGFIAKIQDLVAQTMDITTEVNRVTQTVSKLIEKNVKLVSKEKAEIETVAQASQEMAQTSRDVAMSTENAMEVSDRARKQMDDGSQVVRGAVSGIEALSHEIGRSAEVVSELEKQTDSIGAVLEVINNITDQTNLLALNAAIEAARAGEMGRGFSVVADEVRTLASRTHDSTRSIQEIISKLQHTAREASQAMQSSSQQAGQGVQQVGEIQQVLDDTLANIGQIQERMHNIAAANSQQAAIAEEVAKNVGQVHELADESVHETADVKDSMRQLEELSSGLNRVLKQFRV
ncbi:methyl-accepting chemotaxis protein [Aliiglaciecola sp. CAU 1673]|uniref:methyl-accepting chemotaxis protein n=1 Tax=Aliiglaciecola sp. CAU 1673 TaxID=3032595 RepID=UPI0023DC8C8B|nr:methyl-accepting chemotaxis protein [Aliiglaciecola sp. CAU 1673]MDF2176801.1 methyl-accepting chemotaxis protein [Aliiglaciecola sp. CAU 1673]